MKSIGQVAYEAYCQFTNGKSQVTGGPLPQWAELLKEMQQAWEAAARAVIN